MEATNFVLSQNLDLEKIYNSLSDIKIDSYFDAKTLIFSPPVTRYSLPWVVEGLYGYSRAHKTQIRQVKAGVNEEFEKIKTNLSNTTDIDSFNTTYEYIEKIKIAVNSGSAGLKNLKDEFKKNPGWFATNTTQETAIKKFSATIDEFLETTHSNLQDIQKIISNMPLFLNAKEREDEAQKIKKEESDKLGMTIKNLFGAIIAESSESEGSENEPEDLSSLLSKYL